jgi:hypothetical protein
VVPAAADAGSTLVTVPVLVAVTSTVVLALAVAPALSVTFSVAVYEPVEVYDFEGVCIELLVPSPKDHDQV